MRWRGGLLSIGPTHPPPTHTHILRIEVIIVRACVRVCVCHTMCTFQLAHEEVKHTFRPFLLCCVFYVCGLESK